MFVKHDIAAPALGVVSDTQAYFARSGYGVRLGDGNAVTPVAPMGAGGALAP